MSSKLSRANATTEQLIRETADRMRRVETRVTKYLISTGFDTQADKPLWLTDPDTGRKIISIPSKNCALQDILTIIPKDWDHDIDVFHHGEFVMNITTVPE